MRTGYLSRGPLRYFKSWIVKSLQENGIFAVGLGLSSRKIYLEITHNSYKCNGKSCYTAFIKEWQ